MFSYIWPIALVVVSNTVYHICAKSVPENMNPFASLTVTYLVAAAASALAFFVSKPGGSLPQEYRSLNWAPVALGVVIIGLEVGFIFAYKAGWKVSTASVVQSSFLAVVLMIVGALAYREAITLRKIAGMAICLVGLYFINQ